MTAPDMPSKAVVASSTELNCTYAIPLGCPLFMSVGMRTALIGASSPNALETSSSVASNARFAQKMVLLGSLS